jgi:hypothetical protein
MPQTCPHCGSQAADDARACPSCGASLSAGSRGTQDAPSVSAPAPEASAAAAPSASAMPAYKFDAARLTLADRITGIATVVLFISLFLPWYTASNVLVSSSVNGLWHGWMYIALILSVAIIAYLILRAGWDRLPISQEVPHVMLVTVATLINVLLTVIAFFDKPSGGFGISVGWGLGAVLGLIAAIVAAAPFAVPQLRAKTMS